MGGVGHNIDRHITKSSMMTLGHYARYLPQSIGKSCAVKVVAGSWLTNKLKEAGHSNIPGHCLHCFFEHLTNSIVLCIHWSMSW